MYIKKITYEDYNGVTRTEEACFNLSKTEVMEMQLTTDGGMDKKIQKIVDSKNNKEIIELFKDIICRSYGIKSDDGKRFIKSQEITNEFMQTPAYDELFLELASNTDEATKFINGIMPKMPAGEAQVASIAGSIKPVEDKAE